MHESSMTSMKKFIDAYLYPNKPTSILDVGSMQVKNHHTYKQLCMYPEWTYCGLDISEGPNVDVVTSDPYVWPVSDDSFDVVISGQCLEHVKDMYRWIREVARVLRPGGLCCIIAPCAWPQHRYPVDCWRIYPDGMGFLLQDIAGLDIRDLRFYYNRPHNWWTYKLMRIRPYNNGDTIGIAMKPRIQN